jgi:RNA polymerase sigma-70 factor (ECF subfamily)
LKKKVEQIFCRWDVYIRYLMSSPSTASTALSPLLDTSSTAPGNRRERLEGDVVALFDQFRNPLLRYLSSFGIAFPDGEEVIQEVFLSLFQHLDRGKSRENLRGWLFRVAHNLGLKRRYRSRRDLEARVEGGVEYLAMDPDLNPEDQLAHSQRLGRVRKVVQALPELDRRCLSLRAEGLRYREIAGVLDMSLGAVSLSLSRSLARVARAADR